MDFKLEVVVLPVSDVDRAKAFHEQLGFRRDIEAAHEELAGLGIEVTLRPR